MVLIGYYLLLVASLSLIGCVFLNNYSDNDTDNTIVDKDSNTIKYLYRRMYQDKIDCVIVDVRISRDDDTDRIKNMIAARDRYIENPTNDNEIEYQIAQYYVWYHDTTIDGTQGRIVL